MVGRRFRLGFLPLAIVAVAAPARAEDPKSPWRSKDVLEARVTEACDAVEKACGAKFQKRPVVRISTPAEIEEVVREDLTPLLEAVGYGDQADTLVELASKVLVAKYDDREHAIHVLPDNVDRVAKEAREPSLPTEDVLRVVLAHEAVHALDFPRLGWSALRRSRKTMDELEAFGAVVEGHAQLVAEEIASAWGLSHAFEAFTRSISAIPETDNAIQRRMLEATAARLSFGYVVGHAFLKAIQKERGREGVEAVLREPPTTRRVIENPRLWLSPEKERGVDIRAALAGLGSLFEDARWAVETDAMLRAVLATQFTSLPAEARDPVLAAYDEGAVVVAIDSKTQGRVIGAVLSFHDEVAAVGFSGLERALLEARDKAMPPSVKLLEAVYEDGAGAGGKRKGLVSKKRLKIGDQEIAAISHVAVVGRFLLELNLVGDVGSDRAAHDAAVERVAAILEGKLPPPKPLARRAPGSEPANDLPPPHPDLPRLTVRVVGPDGSPVPLAHVTIHAEPGEVAPGDAGRRTTSFGTDTREGRVVLPRLPGEASLDVRRARAPDGTPLPLAPARAVPVEEGKSEVVVTLGPGLAIEGRVVDDEGRPVPGAILRAAYDQWDESHRDDYPLGVDAEGRARAERSQFRSGTDGSFRIVGAGPESYRLVVEPLPGYAMPETVEARGGATGVVVKLGRAKWTTLAVTDEQGEPVEGARVTVSEFGNGRIAIVFGGFTDSKGRVVIPALREGVRHGLSVRPEVRPDLAERSIEIWRPDQTQVTLARGFEVRGVVRDPEGKPAVGVEVVARLDRTFVRVWTSEDGTFRFRGLPHGPIRIEVSGEGTSASTIVRPEKPTVELILSKPK